MFFYYLVSTLSVPFNPVSFSYFLPETFWDCIWKELIFSLKGVICSLFPFHLSPTHPKIEANTELTDQQVLKLFKITLPRALQKLHLGSSDSTDGQELSLDITVSHMDCGLIAVIAQGDICSLFQKKSNNLQITASLQSCLLSWVENLFGWTQLWFEI